MFHVHGRSGEKRDRDKVNPPLSQVRMHPDLFQILERACGHSLTFRGGHAFCGCPVRRRTSGPHLENYQHLAIPDHKVNFARGHPHVPGNDFPITGERELRGDGLTDESGPLARSQSRRNCRLTRHACHLRTASDPLFAGHLGRASQKVELHCLADCSSPARRRWQEPSDIIIPVGQVLHRLETSSMKRGQTVRPECSEVGERSIALMVCELEVRVAGADI